MKDLDLNTLDFSKGGGLMPVIVQNQNTHQVLMQAWMNREALEATLAKRRLTLFSRKKQRLWMKGESSGNYMEVLSIHPDCDKDCLLIGVNPAGPACHTGTVSCFDQQGTAMKEPGRDQEPDLEFLVKLETLLRNRRQADPKTSYTASLFAAGIKQIAKKTGEEAVELILEAEQDDRQRFIEEAADLLYHLNVLLIAKGMGLQEIVSELKKRHKA